MWLRYLAFAFVYVGWIAAIAAIACSVVARVSRRVKRFIKDIPLSVWTFTTITLALGTYLFILSQHVGGLVDPAFRTKTPIIDSMTQTMRCFTASDDVTLDETAVKAMCPLFLWWVYLLTNSLAHMAAPAEIIMGIYLLGAKLFSTPVLRMRAAKSDTYVFSRLNENSFKMAISIQEHYKVNREVRRGLKSDGGADSTRAAGETDRCLIAFAKTQAMEDDQLYSDAVTAGMVCLDQSAEAVSRYVKDGKARRTYIFSDKDDTENLQEGSEFVQKFVTRVAQDASLNDSDKQSYAYLLAATPVAESFIDAANDMVAEHYEDPRSRICVRRADWIRSTVETLLWEMPLFLTERPAYEGDGSQEFTLYRRDARRVVIVGGGALGSEFLKAALWCSQLGGVRFTFDVVDLHANALRERLAYDAPEIMAHCGEGCEYHINFLQMNARTGEYVEHLKNNRGEITYVLVALGDDVTNVQVARRTREVLEQGGHGALESLRSRRPLVAAVVRDDALAASIANMKTGGGASYDILAVGNTEQVYSFENVFRFELDRIGRNVNRAYWGCYENEMAPDDLKALQAQADAGYERLEYNLRSSRASAIHLKYNLYAFLRHQAFYDNDGEEESIRWSPLVWTEGFFEKTGDPTKLTEVAREYSQQARCAETGDDAMAKVCFEQISRIEHDRWNAYMRTEGYEVADRDVFEAFVPDTLENQNRLSRQHVCLVPFDQLDEVGDFVVGPLNRALGQTGRPARSKPDYKRQDDAIVYHLFDIVCDFND